MVVNGSCGGAVKGNAVCSSKRTLREASLKKYCFLHLCAYYLPLSVYRPVVLSFLAVWHGWTVLPALMLILFSVLQLELTLALCILCEWPPSGQIPLSHPHFSLLYFFCPPPLSFVLVFFTLWISSGYCAAVQGAEMLLATGLRSNLTAGTCWARCMQESSMFGWELLLCGCLYDYLSASVWLEVSVQKTGLFKLGGLREVVVFVFFWVLIRSSSSCPVLVLKVDLTSRFAALPQKGIESLYWWISFVVSFKIQFYNSGVLLLQL